MNWNLAYAPHDECRGISPCTIAEIRESGFPIVSAEVPGNFELDLMRAGKLEDLYFSENTLKAQQLETTHVWYFTTVTVADAGQYLRFEGIDTFAEIYVNGRLMQSAHNMQLSCEMHPDWRAGENEVVVHIRPTVLEARKHVSPAACNALKYSYPALYVRKPAHMFGWDIMPRIVSAGLWKPVVLCDPKREKINEIYLTTHRIDLVHQTADLYFYINADLDDVPATEYTVRIEASCGEHAFVKEETLWHNTHAFGFSVKDCQFWWPKNAGKPNLYDTKVELLHKGRVCDTYRLELGIRTKELVRTETTTEQGDGEFCFKINGKKVFVLGTNWVPLDAFHSQDDKRLSRALALLDDIGCNMVRCWGGNLYESDAFFSFCDRHGIMVWQDFSMGCAVYPRDLEFVRLLEEEAVYQIKRLRNHASLTLWAGDNENDLACYDWNGFVRNPNQNTLTRELLPELVAMHDYTTPFLPSSPYMSEAVFQGKGILPENHLWGPRDYFKGNFYRNTFCHFASEIGYPAFPCVLSLKRFLKEPEKIFRENGTATDEYLIHGAGMETLPTAPYAYRIRLAYTHVQTLFETTRPELADFVKQSQISQAEAKKYFIEKFRIAKWKRTGIIWWNLLDGWPQVSDAIVDYYFQKKLAYHYIKRSQEPLCLMFDEPENHQIRLTAVNDLPRETAFRYTVQRVEADGSLREVLRGKATAAPDSVTVLDGLPISEDEQAFYLIRWQENEKLGQNHYFTHLLRIDDAYYLKALQVCGMDSFEA